MGAAVSVCFLPQPVSAAVRQHSASSSAAIRLFQVMRVLLGSKLWLGVVPSIDKGTVYYTSAARKAQGRFSGACGAGGGVVY